MKFIRLVAASLFIASLTSCTMTENIYINEDGSGKFDLEMDGSALMAMIPKDSLKSAAVKVIDSTFTFKELFDSKKDSISKLSKEQQDRLKKMEQFTMKIKMNPDHKEFAFSVLTDFKKISELQDAMATIGEVQNMDKKSMTAIAPTGFGQNNATLHYSYDGKKFVRKSIVNKKKAKITANDSAQAYKMIYESSTYIMKYHFPKKVKKVSNEKASYSEDRKTITIEYPFNEYIDNPEKLNFEVQFE